MWSMVVSRHRCCDHGSRTPTDATTAATRTQAGQCRTRGATSSRVTPLPTRSLIAGVPVNLRDDGQEGGNAAGFSEGPYPQHAGLGTVDVQHGDHRANHCHASRWPRSPTPPVDERHHLQRPGPEVTAVPDRCASGGVLPYLPRVPGSRNEHHLNQLCRPAQHRRRRRPRRFAAPTTHRRLHSRSPRQARHCRSRRPVDLPSSA